MRGSASGYPIDREKEAELNISRFIEVNELQQQMTGGAALTIIDVRGPDEFVGELGHIPGAVNIPVGDIANRLIEIKVLGGKPVIMVCKTDRRSAVGQASAIRWTAANSLGWRWRRALRMVAAFQTKMPLFQ